MPESCDAAGGELGQIQFLLGHGSLQTTERISAVSSAFAELCATGSALNHSALSSYGVGDYGSTWLL
ncbi:MAG TPA: hypothetical protein VKX49_01345 [Bryobacteraceae bacterium]|nr:hypothetical protein [Bryobacteraceae bacterium]